MIDISDIQEQMIKELWQAVYRSKVLAEAIVHLSKTSECAIFIEGLEDTSVLLSKAEESINIERKLRGR